jgi:methionyl-tRNA synthetase
MSKRLGKIVTMDDLINEVGKDVARFFFIDRRTNAHLNFDMDLATQESEENPVYYIQYAHARINSLIKKARKDHDIRIGKPSRTALSNLKEGEEITIMKKLIDFPQLLVDIADTREPNRLATYVYELAGMVHKFYGKHKVIDLTDLDTTKGRLFLMTAVKSVIAISLSLIGVSAPEKMKSKTTAAKKTKAKDGETTTKAKKTPKKEKVAAPKPEKKTKPKAEAKAKAPKKTAKDESAKKTSSAKATKETLKKTKAKAEPKPKAKPKKTPKKKEEGAIKAKSTPKKKTTSK